MIVQTHYLHITLDSEDLFKNRLRSHPLDWQFLPFLYFVHLTVQLAHQTKVAYFESFTMPHQNVPCCQVSVDEALLSKVALQINKNYRCYIPLDRSEGVGAEVSDCPFPITYSFVLHFVKDTTFFPSFTHI